MLVQVYKWLSVYFFSMVKFVGGPLSGIATGLTVFETIVFTILGMMTSVLVFSTIGSWIKDKMEARFQRKKPVFSKNSRRIVTVWSKYGVQGVAFLTPLIFTPIGGTMIVVSFGVPLKKILLFMFISAFFWAVTISFALHYFGHALGLR